MDTKEKILELIRKQNLTTEEIKPWEEIVETPTSQKPGKVHHERI